MNGHISPKPCLSCMFLFPLSLLRSPHQSLNLFISNPHICLSITYFFLLWFHPLLSSSILSKCLAPLPPLSPPSRDNVLRCSPGAVFISCNSVLFLLFFCMFPALFFYETLLKGSECYLPLLWFLKNGIQVKFVSNVVTWGKKTEYYSLIQTKVCMTWHFSSSFFWTQQLGLIHTGWKAGFLHIYK